MNPRREMRELFYSDAFLLLSFSWSRYLLCLVIFGHLEQLSNVISRGFRVEMGSRLQVGCRHQESNWDLLAGCPIPKTLQEYPSFSLVNSALPC